jgi:putative spermidine/putrescine transport system substrate-binding protein
MKARDTRVATWAALGLLVAALCMVAASCGGDDGEGGASTEIEGLGTSLEEIQELARGEGEVNLIIWPAYAVRIEEFTAATGCNVTTKVGTSSDDMVSLMQTGAYDGGSFSGNATVRMMLAGDVAPVNTEFLTNYEDISDGLRDQDYNSLEGQSYGIPHGRGPNLLMFRTDEVPEDTNSWGVVWEDDQLAKYKGKISIYDAPDFIADAALWLKATQPELEIDSPYQLNDEQFAAAVDLLKKQAPFVGEYWPADVVKQIGSFTSGDSVVGTTWPYQVNQLNQANVPIKAIKPQEGTTGWSDTWMISSQAANPNCMYLWMDHMGSPESQATVAEAFGEAPANLEACDLTTNPNHCEDFHADDEAYWEDVYYWTTPAADCGDDDDETTCKTQADWQAAWTEIRG